MNRTNGERVMLIITLWFLAIYIHAFTAKWEGCR